MNSQQTQTFLLSRTPINTAPLNCYAVQSYPQTFITESYPFTQQPYQHQENTAQEVHCTLTWLLIPIVTLTDRFLNLVRDEAKIINLTPHLMNIQ